MIGVAARSKGVRKPKKKRVEEAGIEPATCRMQSDHSAPELHPRFGSDIDQVWCRQTIEMSAQYSPFCRIFEKFLRKKTKNYMIFKIGVVAILLFHHSLLCDLDFFYIVLKLFWLVLVIMFMRHVS